MQHEALKNNSASIDHLGIAVKNLQAAKSFYSMLGLEISDDEIVEQEQVKLAMVKVGDSRLELLEPLSEESPVGRFIISRGEGLHHIALRVPDIEARLEELKTKGVRLVSNTVQRGAGGHLYFFVHPSSAGGVLMEIVQDAPEGR
jgi:methylmalonyl-CoA epimerase